MIGEIYCQTLARLALVVVVLCSLDDPMPPFGASWVNNDVSHAKLQCFGHCGC